MHERYKEFLDEQWPSIVELFGNYKGELTTAKMHNTDIIFSFPFLEVVSHV